MEVSLGDSDRALAALMDYWAVAPLDGLRPLGLARRIARDEEILADAAQGVWERGPSGAAVYQREFFDLVRRAGDASLARVLWERLDRLSRTQEILLFPYLQTLIADGSFTEADGVWQQLLGDPPGLVNGSFEEPITPLGPDFTPGWATSGWRYHAAGEGFRIGLDTERVYAGRLSLRVSFEETHNVDLSHLSQIIRVRPGRRYRLSGHWAANALTTRSGVFVELFAVDARPPVRVQTSARWGSWDWEPVELEIQVPEESLLVAVRVRRASTTAQDRLLGGTLWLDAFDLHPSL
jgi:hypothetical protein